MAEKSQQKRRILLKRLAIAVALIVAIGCSTANFAARIVVEHQLQSLLQSEASVGSVHLSLSQICIRNIRVSGTSSENPLLTIATVDVGLTIFDGLSNGIWANEVKVSEPTLFLKFSKTGELLTQLPQPDATEGGDGSIPIQRLKVVGGAMEISQTGAQSFRTTNAAAAIDFGESIRIAAVLPELLGGLWKLSGELDAKSLAGGLRISATGLSAASADLSNLPLVAAELNATDEFTASGSLEAQCIIPANMKSPLDCSVNVDCRIDSFTLPGRELQAQNLTATMQHSAGQVNLLADADVLGGTVHFDGLVHVHEVDRAYQLHHGRLNWTVQGLQLEPIAQQLKLPGRIAAVLNASGSATAMTEQNQLRLDASASSDFSQIELLGIRSAPLNLRAQIVGGIVDLSSAPRPTQGNILLSATSQGIAVNDLVAQLLPRLQSLSAAGRTELGPIIQRLQRWEAGGRISLSAELSAPLQALSDVRLVKGSGGIACQKIAVAGFVAPNIVAAFDVHNGTADLQLNTAQVVDLPAGQTINIAGRCQVPFIPAGRATAEAEIGNLPLDSAALLAGIAPETIVGTASVRMNAEVPVARLSDPASWIGHGDMASSLVMLHGEPISDCQLQWSLGNQRIEISQLAARWHKTVLTAQAKADIVHPFRFDGHVALGDLDLALVAPVVNRLSSVTMDATGMTRLTGTIVGDAASMNYQCDGEVLMENLVLASKTMGTHRIKWSLTPNRLNIEEGSSQFFGGDLAITANLRPDGEPISRVSGRIHNIQTSALGRVLGLQQSADGAIDLDFDFLEPMRPQHINGQFNARSREVHVAGVPVETFQGTISVQSGSALAALDTRIAGVECVASVQTKIADMLAITPAALNDPNTFPVWGELTLKQISVERLQRTLAALPGQPRIPPELNGLVEVQLKRTAQTAETGALLAGSVAIRNLMWNRVVWSKELMTRLQVTPKSVEIREITGTFADGRVAGRGVVSLTGQPDGNFRLTVSRMNMAKAAAPLQQRSGRIMGSADLQIEGRLGRRISGRASVSVDRAKIHGVSFTHARLPLDWSVVPSTKDIHVSTSAAAMNIGGGRVRGEADARWNGRLDLNLSGMANNVDTKKLLGSNGGLGGGTLNGSMHLRARGASSINDFSGQFQGTLKDAQALKLPVLDQTSRFLGSLSRSTAFEDGTIKGRLANGVVTLEQINLMASNVRMVIEGSATLTGHLNLFVSAYTSETGPADKLLDFANSPIMLAAPAPVTVVAKINDALKDRTIHINVGGTVGKPLVRLQPGRQLQQEALRFLVSSSLNYSPTRTQKVTR